MHSETPGHDHEPRSSDVDLVTRLLSVSRSIAAEVLMASAMHEIHNQLVGLHARTQQLRLEPRVRENRIALDVLMEVDERLTNCVKDIRGLRSLVRCCKNVEGPSSCDVHAEIIRFAETWMTFLRSAKCKLQLRLEARQSHVRIAPEHLQEIMSVLLVNSVQARSKEVTVTTSVREDLWISDICTLRLALQVMFQDNGDGLPCIGTPDELFAPGCKTNSEAAGLGLFVARSLARRAGGELSYAGSSKEHGAAFSLALPMTEQ